MVKSQQEEKGWTPCFKVQRLNLGSVLLYFLLSVEDEEREKALKDSTILLSLFWDIRLRSGMCTPHQSGSPATK